MLNSNIGNIVFLKYNKKQTSNESDKMLLRNIVMNNDPVCDNISVMDDLDKRYNV
jgi:hypothetical protein